MIASAFVLSPLFLACNEYELEATNDNFTDIRDDAEPNIVVDPTSITFDTIAVADGGTITEVVTISNDGEADLNLTDIYLDDPGVPYDIGSVTSVLVPPENSTEFTVTFAPETDGAFDGLIYIESNDPDEPVVEVELTGIGEAPVIEVTPLEYNFGDLYIGCDLEQEITISNIGNALLLVDEIEFSVASDDLAVDLAEESNGSLSKGWEIPGGTSISVWVDYAPLDEVQDIAYLKVHSNDPFSPTVLATQEGQGVLYGQNTDSFEQPINGPVDILFALDWSGSMYDDIANVQSNFDTFIDTLQGLDSDYHVAAVTADSGCFADAGGYNYVDNTMTTDLQQDTFDSFVNDGGSGTFTEAPFQLLTNALSSSNTASGGCNDGFYRDAANLATLNVSDEPEQSPNSYSYYVKLFQAMKSDSDMVVMHAIAGDVPNGCGGNSAGTGHYEATVATGGLFLSICATDFGDHLESIAEGSVSENRVFELTLEPVPETIDVRIDGVSTSAGWEYQETGNYVEFSEDNIPEPGTSIDIEYALKADCIQ